MGSSVVGPPAVWDDRGAVRPERLARRRRLANGAAAAALLIAVPAVVGSSAGWWSSTDAVDSAGGAAGVSPLAEPGQGSIGSLAPDPLAPGGEEGAGVEAGLVGLGGPLLDVDVDLDDACVAGPDGEPVVVGVVAVGLAGSATVAGPDPVPLEVVVARRVAALVNCAGGVIDRPVEVAVAEAAGSPLATRDAVVGLVNRGASVVIGPSSVPVALRTAEAVAGRVAVLSPLSVEPALDDRARGLFLIDPDAVTLASAAAQHARGQGWRTAAVLVGSDPLEDLAATAFADAFVAGGGLVTAQLPLVVGPEGAVELDGQVGRLGGGPVPRSPPDVVFSAADLAIVGGLRSALVEAGLDVPVVGIDRRRPGATLTPAIDGTVVDGVPVDGVEIVGSRPVEPDGRVARLQEALRSSTGARVDDPMAAARLADAVLVALDAVDRADTSEAGVVLDRLREPHTIEGMAGPTGVWPGPPDDEARSSIPVLGSGPDGPILAASVVVASG